MSPGCALGQREVGGVDAVDDVEMARQQPLEQFDRPGLQRLRQQRVVGVGQRLHLILHASCQRKS